MSHSVFVLCLVFFFNLKTDWAFKEKTRQKTERNKNERVLHAGKNREMRTDEREEKDVHKQVSTNMAALTHTINASTQTQHYH